MTLDDLDDYEPYPQGILSYPGPKPRDQTFYVNISAAITLCSDGSCLHTREELAEALAENFWDWLETVKSLPGEFLSQVELQAWDPPKES